jgi:hypothetical protein
MHPTSSTRDAYAPPASRPPVVVVSQWLEEPTTDEVIDWLLHMGIPVERINGEELTSDTPFRIALGDGPGEHPAQWRAQVDGLELGSASAYWLRRWHTRTNLSYLRDADGHGHGRLPGDLHDFLRGEIAGLRDGVLLSMDGSYAVTNQDQLQVSKLRMLALAAACGLRIPATLITNDRAELLAFIRRHGSVITKPVSEGKHFRVEGETYGLYTAALDERAAASLPERFFPSAFQRQVDKAFEVRTFVLDEETWSMAIFSQGGATTQTDFRRRSSGSFNRTVPYALPEADRQAVLRFMKEAGLTTGSLDLIRDGGGTHWFLEVNPVGQFGMVSAPCNYHIEKRMAERLAQGGRSDAR